MPVRLRSNRPEERRLRLSETALHWICLGLVCLGTLSVAVIQRGQLHLDDGEALEALNQATMQGGAIMSRVSMSVLYSALFSCVFKIEVDFNFVFYERRIAYE